LRILQEEGQADARIWKTAVSAQMPTWELVREGTAAERCTCELADMSAVLGRVPEGNPLGGDQMGTVYLIHIEPPYRHAKHYLGFTYADDSPKKRFDRHVAGRGSPLIKAALEAGSSVEVVRVWKNVDRTLERTLKLRKNTPTLCPICKQKKRSTTTR
jgi:hypothetical protein